MCQVSGVCCARLDHGKACVELPHETVADLRPELKFTGSQFDGLAEGHARLELQFGAERSPLLSQGPLVRRWRRRCPS